MNTIALREVFAKLRWHVDERDYADQVARARQTLADPNAVASSKEVCTRILAAAGERAPGVPPAAPGPVRAAEPPAPASTDADEVLLGLAADGKELTVADFCARHTDPLEYLGQPGAVLTAAGLRMQSRLKEATATDPLRRARKLGIDIEAVATWARSAGHDFLDVLQAEIELQEQIRADRAAAGQLVVSL